MSAPAAAATNPEVPVEKKEEEITTIADPNVVTKYKEAAKIASEALALVLKTAADGVAILDLVKLSDEFILERTSKLYNSKKGVTKGVAFPTSISKNNIVGHFAPMEKDQDQPLLETGDVVKIDLGVHIDGYIALVAQTFAVPATAGTATTAPIKGRAADAYAACLTAADAALRSLRPGNKNTNISELIQKIAAEYKVTPVQGVLSHQLLKNKIDGDKAIINRVDPEHKIEECEFKENEVYAIDIVMSTGEGKPKEIDNRQTTVYKRNPQANYSLKHAISRKIFSEIQTKYGSQPFSLRWLEVRNTTTKQQQCKRTFLSHASHFHSSSDVSSFVSFFCFSFPRMPLRLASVSPRLRIMTSSSLTQSFTRRRVSSLPRLSSLPS